MKQNLAIIGIQDQASGCSIMSSIRKSKAKTYKLAKTTEVKKDDFQKWFDHYLIKKNIKKKPQHFQNIIKQQHKRMYVSNFLKKLKRIIVPRNQAYHEVLDIHETEHSDGWKGYQMSKNQECLYSILFILSNLFLIIFITLSLTFEEVQHSENYNFLLAISLIMHMIQIIKQCICAKVIASHKIIELNEIIADYLKTELIFDALISLCFIALFIIQNDSPFSIALRLLILLKLKTLSSNIFNIQLNFIDNLYREQMWNFGKMIITNFFFAHFICIIFVIMTDLSPNLNWITKKQLQDIPWFQLYIWAYYWAITTMVSVGYGDIVPTVWQQALVLIFVQILSCLFFAYNIHCMGNILQKLKSYDIQTYSNMKTFNHYIQSTNISNQLQGRLRNYIKQSATMKKQTNLQEQRQFLNNLPQSFKTDLLKESNQRVWKQILFFKNLSQKMIHYLSLKVQKVLTHPEQMIYKRRSTLQTIIFQSGSYSFLYNRPLIFNSLSSNGKQVQSFKLQKGSYKLLSLDFLFGKSLNFDVKSNDYTVIYKLSNQNLLFCLRDNPYDFEYYCTTRDKDSILLNQFQVNDCQICQKQKHNLFKCPKLHYIPLKQHLIRKYIKSNKVNQKYLMVVDTYRKNRKFYTCYKDRKDYKQNILKYRCFLIKKSNGNTYIPTLKNLQTQNDYISQISKGNIFSNSIIGELIEIGKTRLINNKKQFLKDQIEQIYTKLMQKPPSIWQIQTDCLHNFKYYFKSYNPENLANKKISNLKELSKSKLIVD